MNDFESIRESARKSFEKSRTASSGIVRTAGLWAAALAIIWLTGLEPTLHVVKQTSRSLVEINSATQYAELRVSSRKRQLVNEQQELDKLKEFNRNCPDDDKRTKEYNNLKKIYDERQTKDGTREGEQAKTRYDEFKSLWDKLKESSIEDREKLVATTEKDLENEAQELKKTYLEIKEKGQQQDRNIGFNLFGIEFKSPVLIAPLLWCFFCVGLLGYLSNVRGESIKFSIDGILELARLPDFSGDTIAAISGRLPTWTIKPWLTKFASIEGKGNEYKTLVEESWVNNIFGSSDERNLADALLFLMPLIFFAALVRICWISLDLSRNLGPTWARALLPIALIMILSLMMMVCRCWLVGDKFLTWFNLKRKTIISYLVLGISLVPILLFKLRFSIWFGDILQDSLKWITVTLFIAYIPAYVAITKQPKPKHIRTILVSRISRRNFLFAFLFASVSGGIAFSLTSFLFQKLTKSISSRQLTKSSPKTLAIPLTPGFYQTLSTNNDKTDTSNKSVLHYIGMNGIYSKRGRLPNVKRLKKTDPPIQLDISLEPQSSNNQDEKNFCSSSEPLLRSGNELPHSDIISESSAPPEKQEISGSNASSDSRREAESSSYPRHVHLASASWSFEEAAIAILQSGSIDSHKTKEVCQLLLCGIQHDLLYKQSTNNIRKKAQPSFRLYDLLAGISVRFREDESLQNLLEIIRKSEYQIVLEPRIEKWQNVSGAWHQRWRNPHKRIKWRSRLGAVVF